MSGWNASNLIALIALFIPLAQSASSAYQTKKKVEADNKNKAAERKEKQYENQIKPMQELFEAYATLTQEQISTSWHPFDKQQRSAYLKVLLFAEGEFRAKLKSFDSLCYHVGQEEPKRKAFSKVIDSYCEFIKEKQNQSNS